MEVLADGPAARAGIQAGDILIAIDGAPATSVDELHRLLSVERIGTPVSVELLRRERRFEMTLRPVELA